MPMNKKLMMIGTAGVSAVVFQRKTSMALLGKILFFLPQEIFARFRKKTELFIDGLSIFNGLRQFTSMAVYSILPWILWAGFLYFSLLAFDLHLPLYGILFITTIIHLGILIPSMQKKCSQPQRHVLTRVKLSVAGNVILYHQRTTLTIV